MTASACSVKTAARLKIPGVRRGNSSPSEVPKVSPVMSILSPSKRTRPKNPKAKGRLQGQNRQRRRDPVHPSRRTRAADFPAKNDGSVVSVPQVAKKAAGTAKGRGGNPTFAFPSPQRRQVHPLLIADGTLLLRTRGSRRGRKRTTGKSPTTSSVREAWPAKEKRARNVFAFGLFRRAGERSTDRSTCVRSAKPAPQGRRPDGSLAPLRCQRPASPSDHIQHMAFILQKRAPGTGHGLNPFLRHPIRRFV
jgi:hypothetical protein